MPKAWLMYMKMMNRMMIGYSDTDHAGFLYPDGHGKASVSGLNIR
jgi:hypothetical protein